MNSYVTGAMIRKLREERRMTQARLAEMLGVSDKAVSKWETGRGYPDIALLEPLAGALGLSVAELLAGESVCNTNRSSNMARMRFYVCPICGNVITATGEAMISCCGITLPALEAEDVDLAADAVACAVAGADLGAGEGSAADAGHAISVQRAEDEYYVTVAHDMSKEHYISFIAGVKDDGCELRKLYPEGPAEARFKIAGTRWLYCYCNKHGLFRMRVRPGR